MQESIPSGVSVIICCYNSAQRLPETIKHLALQKADASIAWEIIVVNNSSIDNTSVVVKEEWKKYHINIPLTVVNQSVPGLIYARNKGLEVAQYEYCLFCDDDNHLEANYISKAYELMRSKPEIGILGCWVKPKLPFYPGKWIEDCYSALAIGKQAEHDGYVNWVFGAGMIFRKRILEELKSRNITLMLSGRIGSKQTSGEDAEMCLLTRYIGYRVYYSSSLVLYHAISNHRLNKRSFIKANCQNFFPIVYLYLMDNMVKDVKSSSSRLLLAFLKERTVRVLSFIPRFFLGKHRFYSFLTIYSNIFLLLWLMPKVSTFLKVYSQIKQNLYNDR